MKIAFITPSYHGDFERCKLLAESTSKFLDRDIEHILIIDRRDMELFRPLQNEVVRLVESESLTPWWMFRIPGVKNWWMSLHSVPVRNWIYQQFLKLAAVHATDADILQFVDSDVTLTRPFPRDYLFDNNGRVRLQRVRYSSPDHEKWIKIACDLLGVNSMPGIDPNYIGSFITWTRPNALEMVEHIRDAMQASHWSAIANKIHFSEYMTYGVFIDAVKGIENSGHFHDPSPNLHLCWGHDLSSQQGVNRFLDTIRPEHFGIMVHSKLGTPLDNYRRMVYRMWDNVSQPQRIASRN